MVPAHVNVKSPLEISKQGKQIHLYICVGVCTLYYIHTYICKYMNTVLYNNIILHTEYYIRCTCLYPYIICLYVNIIFNVPIYIGHEMIATYFDPISFKMWKSQRYTKLKLF